jgi:hypothetical protein
LPPPWIATAAFETAGVLEQTLRLGLGEFSGAALLGPVTINAASAGFARMESFAITSRPAGSRGHYAA